MKIGDEVHVAFDGKVYGFERYADYLVVLVEDFKGDIARVDRSAVTFKEPA
jgi:hypothetical protein